MSSGFLITKCSEMTGQRVLHILHCLFSDVLLYSSIDTTQELVTDKLASLVLFYCQDLGDFDLLMHYANNITMMVRLPNNMIMCFRIIFRTSVEVGQRGLKTILPNLLTLSTSGRGLESIA